MREQRLLKDMELLVALNDKSALIKIAFNGMPPERYRVTYYCNSFVWANGNKSPSISNLHELNIYLHKEYPRRPPALKWLTDIFHPNILPPYKNGGVCIGSWTAAETLDSLCVRIGEMLQYKNYNLEDPLDLEAAKWIRQNLYLLPADNRSLID